MSKKKRKNRSKRTLQQVKKQEPAAVTVDVRTDLRKMTILTAVCLGILFVLFLTQSRWLP